MTISTIYFIGCIVSFVLLIFLIAFYKKEVNIFLLLIFVVVSIALLGYASLYLKKDSTDDLDFAMFSNMLTYIGGCFLPVLMFQCISEICHFNKSKYITFIFLSISVFLFILVITSKYHTLFYKNYELVIRDNYTYFKKEYGPFHLVYIVHLIVMMLSCILVTIRAFFIKKQVSTKNSILMSILISISTLTFVIQKIINTELEFVPFSYICAEIIFLIVLYRLRLYEVASVASNSMAEDYSYGFIILDRRHQYLGSNKTIKKWFPEVNKLSIDHHIEEESDFLKLIHSYCLNNKNTKDHIIRRGDIYIKVNFQILYGKFRHKILAYLVLCEDDTKNQKYLELISNYNNNLEKEVNKKTEHLKNIQNDIIFSMANIVENRDLNTGGHIKRTSNCVRIFVNQLIVENTFPDVSNEFYKNVILAAPLHDFGKIAIPDSILNKNGKFTENEYSIMKTHSEKGAKIVGEILQNVDDENFRKIAINIAYFHHEKYDGTGYPMHLSKDQIPLEARIMALADVFDALVSKRVYKEKYSYDVAFNIIKESMGTHFDEKLAKVFISCSDKLIQYYDNEDC